jgi:uncharacterized protein (DUF934 family)
VLYSLRRHESIASPATPDAVLRPGDAVDTLLPGLPQLRVIAIEFTGPSEGRGYTQARVLRQRYGFTGELRAIGHVKRDQVWFLARVGFDSFELAAGETLDGALASLAAFSVAYAPARIGEPRLRERFARRTALSAAADPGRPETS